jgi:hypothetical protein
MMKVLRIILALILLYLAFSGLGLELLENSQQFLETLVKEKIDIDIDIKW